MSTANCLACHSAHQSKDAALRPAHTHPGFAEGQCQKCHSGASPSKLNLIAPVAVLCVKCHDQVKPQAAGDHVHDPVKKGQCLTCHSPHGSAEEKLLLDSPDKLCARCHQAIAASSQKQHPHAPVAAGECGKCHEPHRSAAGGIALLRKRPGELCLDCHQDLAKRMAEGAGHAPAARGQCLTCHDSHGSDLPGMTKRPGAALCAACHSLKEPRLTAKHPGMAMETVNCTSCHDPHAQAKGAHGLLQPAIHLPFARGECESCHVSKGSAALQAKGAELCITCHDEGGWKGRKFTHQPVTTGAQCINCHSPHGGVAKPILKAPLDDLCFTCHDKRMLQVEVKHKALEKGCMTCHDPHGSGVPQLLRESSIEAQCRKCHTDMSKHFHKMSSDKLTPSGQPLTCTSCHNPHGGAFPGLLMYDAKRDLCIQCHDPSMAPPGK
jgi:predicted CXXCH cytochrome family protein